MNLAPQMVKEVSDEMIRLKRADKLSERYLTQLNYDLKHFADRFHCRLEGVSGAEVDAWLRTFKVGPRTRNNLRRSVQSLFNFGIAWKYLSKDHDEMDAVPLAKVNGGEIQIFTPKEMTKLLAYANKPIIPSLTIGAFAGIRHAEIQLLDWSNVHFDASIIEIRAANAKTASRRTVPMTDNLRASLLKHRKAAEPACIYLDMVSEIISLVGTINKARRAAWAKAEGVSGEQLNKAEEQAGKALAEAKAGQRKQRHKGEVPAGAETAHIEGRPAFDWKHNALRHSFISYRVADIQNVAQVALEAGNNPQMIFKHYRELMRPADAKTWFSIAPGSNGNVIQLPRKRSA
jgi:integrase